MKLVFGTFLSPVLEPFYRALAGFVGRSLECETEFVVGESHEQFARREIDLGFICGLPYVRLAAGPDPVEPLVAPVVNGERYGGRPVYFSDVVVGTDSPARSFDDLRRAAWCFNDPESHSGYGALLYHLARSGLGPDFFGRFEGVGSHLEALARVAEGSFDAAAVDSHLLAVVRRGRPELTSRLRAIHSIGPSPIQPLVAGAHVPADVREGVRGILLNVHDDTETRPALEYSLVERLVAVRDAVYDDIRAMRSAAQAAGMDV